jgi:hypothetical protein
MPQIYGAASMALPTAAADGTQKQVRLDRSGNQFVVPLTAGLSGLAAEGSYFRATNPTPGTSLAQAVTASFADTTAILCIRNNESAGGKTIYLDYLWLFMTVIPASSTAWKYAVTIEPAARAPSGGNAIAGQNVNSGYTAVSIGTFTFGPTSVAAVVGTRRLISNRTIFNVVPVVNTALLLNFGAQDSGNGQTMNGATAIRLSDQVGPVAIGPAHTGLIHMWYPSNATTGASYEVELGWWER